MKKFLSMIMIGLLCLAVMPVVLMDATLSETPDVVSVFPHSPPRIDGVVAEDEWKGAATIHLAHGLMLVLNDGSSLYGIGAFSFLPFSVLMPHLGQKFAFPGSSSPHLEQYIHIT